MKILSNDIMDKLNAIASDKASYDRLIKTAIVKLVMELNGEDNIENKEKILALIERLGKLID